MPKRKKVLEILDDECKCGEVVAHNRIADRILALFPSEPKVVCDLSVPISLIEAQKELSSLKARMGVGEIEKVILNLPCGTNSGFPSAHNIAVSIVKHLKGEKV